MSGDAPRVFDPRRVPRSELRLTAAVRTAPISLRDDVDAMLAAARHVDELSARLSKVTEHVSSTTRGAKQRVQSMHASRLAMREAHDSALLRQSLGDAAVLHKKALEEQGKHTTHLLDSANAALERDRRRFGWIMQLCDRVYLLWGEFCLYIVVTVATFAPSVSRAVGLPVDALRLLRASRQLQARSAISAPQRHELHEHESVNASAIRGPNQADRVSDLEETVQSFPSPGAMG